MRKRLLKKLGGTTRYSPKKTYSMAMSRKRSYIPRSLPNPAITKFSSSSFRRAQETKTLDVKFSGAYAAGTYTPDTSPLQMLPVNTQTNVVQCLNLVQQGAGISQRIGNKISLKSVRIRLGFAATANDIDTPVQARIIVLYDRQPNGAYASSNNILSDSNQDNTIVNGIATSNLNPNFFDRFVVLKDTFVMLQPKNADSVANTDVNGPTTMDAFVYDEYIKLRNLESQYNGTANPITIAYVNIGALLILVFGDKAAGSDPWQLKGHSRLRFRDN